MNEWVKLKSQKYTHVFLAPLPLSKWPNWRIQHLELPSLFFCSRINQLVVPLVTRYTPNQKSASEDAVYSEQIQRACFVLRMHIITLALLLTMTCIPFHHHRHPHPYSPFQSQATHHHTYHRHHIINPKYNHIISFSLSFLSFTM